MTSITTSKINELKRIMNNTNNLLIRYELAHLWLIDLYVNSVINESDSRLTQLVIESFNTNDQTNISQLINEYNNQLRSSIERLDAITTNINNSLKLFESLSCYKSINDKLNSINQQLQHLHITLNENETILKNASKHDVIRSDSNQKAERE